MSWTCWLNLGGERDKWGQGSNPQPLQLALAAENKVLSCFLKNKTLNKLSKPEMERLHFCINVKFHPASLHRWRLTKPVCRMVHCASGDGETFGYEGQQGEAKPESSETVNLVNWQAKGMAQIWKMEAWGWAMSRGGSRNLQSTEGHETLKFNKSICLASL